MLWHCVKSVRIRSYSGPHFLAFGLDTERYSVSLRFQSEGGKIRTRITANTELYTFHAVRIYNFDKIRSNRKQLKYNQFRIKTTSWIIANKVITQYWKTFFLPMNQFDLSEVIVSATFVYCRTMVETGWVVVLTCNYIRIKTNIFLFNRTFALQAPSLEGLTFMRVFRFYWEIAMKNIFPAYFLSFSSDCYRALISVIFSVKSFTSLTTTVKEIPQPVFCWLLTDLCVSGCSKFTEMKISGKIYKHKN